jgi:hypothetical protein
VVVRVEERGKSKCPAVMVGIRVAALPDCESGADFLLVFSHENTWLLA